MNFELKSLSWRAASRERCEALVVLVSQGMELGDSPLGAWVQRAQRGKDFSAKAGGTLVSWQPADLKARHVMLCGVGDAKPAQLQAALTLATQWAKKQGVSALTVVLPELEASAWSAVVQAVADASYVYQATKPSAKASSLRRVIFAVPQARSARTDFERAKARALGVTLAREWGNRPANHATPAQLAKAAQALTRFPRIRCEVLGPREVARLKMGSFMSVAQGSHEPLRFIVLHYKGGAAGQAPVVLVGKGITFDTGGISLKPGAGMDEMKFDMCGAASVLGTFRALAELQPHLNVVGLIPACENMPSGRAIKPGDVVTSMSGQTIEILNTDAEGRLILCDALTYAKRFKPQAVVDIATLTGACVIALGHVRSGMFATDDALAQDLYEAGEVWQDPCWRMPLDDAYADGLKSHFADVANVADRAAGSVTAAKFLQRFAKDFPWAHLDIAGTAWKSGGAKGATGRPVGLLLGYLLQQAERGAKPAAARKKPRTTSARSAGKRRA